MCAVRVFGVARKTRVVLRYSFACRMLFDASHTYARETKHEPFSDTRLHVAWYLTPHIHTLERVAL